MSTIVRIPGANYKVEYTKISLGEVANSKREFPKEWIAPGNVDVTDNFIDWAMPLIGRNLPEFAEFKEIFAPKLCGERRRK